MLTPVFSCEQDGAFVLVRIVLSAICKVLEAVFDINGKQFTFYCSPYYLRLKFDEELQEGKGERATYNLESNTLTVYLPKAVAGQPFSQLHNPGYLIATDLQRKRLVSVVGGEPAHGTANEEEEEEEEEVEFVQTLADEGAAGAGVLSEATPPVARYGFANHFSGLFSRLDEDVVREMVSLPQPERWSPHERRAMRLEAEAADFSEEAVLLSFEDADGEVADILHYVPAHVLDFQQALQGGGVRYAGLPHAVPRGHAEAEGLEGEEATLPAGGEGQVGIWQGNIAEFRRPLIEEIDGGDRTPRGVTEPETAAAPAGGAPSAPPSPAARGARLATLRTRPQLTFTAEESDTLMRVKPPRLLFPPSADAVAALTVDLLLSEAYDDLVTEGQGCSESLWNLTTLSPALSFLDPADTVYDACVAFARRALVYPLHRHFGLVQRVFSVTGTRLLLGLQYTVRALLRVRRVLVHAELKHLLATLFLDPLIAYWMNVSEADERLTRIALELHEHVTRTRPVAVREPRKPDCVRESDASPFLMISSDGGRQRTLEPITLLTLGLPLEA